MNGERRERLAAVMAVHTTTFVRPPSKKPCTRRFTSPRANWRNSASCGSVRSCRQTPGDASASVMTKTSLSSPAARAVRARRRRIGSSRGMTVSYAGITALELDDGLELEPDRRGRRQRETESLCAFRL